MKDVTSDVTSAEETGPKFFDSFLWRFLRNFQFHKYKMNLEICFNDYIEKTFLQKMICEAMRG